MNGFSLAHLNPTEFEEFCFELLAEIDFKNISWRKGTGLLSSPADQGRDIEAEKMVEPVPGSVSFERWFFECKHYERGVPVEKIQNALAWAEGKCPAKLVLIASGSFSNTTKEFIEHYKESRRPPFQIHLWERKKLEALALPKQHLLDKYKIRYQPAFVSLLNSHHLRFLERPTLNSLDFLFDLLERTDPRKRDRVMQVTYLHVIRPRSRAPVHDKETMGELLIDAVDFESFKNKCFQVKDMIGEKVFVRSLLLDVLSWSFHLGNSTNAGELKRRHQSLVDSILKEDDQERFEDALSTWKTALATIDLRLEENYTLYSWFCDNVVAALFKEPFEDRVIASMRERRSSLRTNANLRGV